MLTSTPDSTLQLVADRHAHLGADVAHRPEPSHRAPPASQRSWWRAATHLLDSRA